MLFAWLGLFTIFFTYFSSLLLVMDARTDEERGDPSDAFWAEYAQLTERFPLPVSVGSFVQMTGQVFVTIFVVVFALLFSWQLLQQALAQVRR